MNVVRELRRLETQPYDDLPQVLFKEEIRFLYEDRERLRRTLETQEEQHKRRAPSDQTEAGWVARSYDAASQLRRANPRRLNQQGFEEIVNGINGIDSLDQALTKKAVLLPEDWKAGGRHRQSPASKRRGLVASNAGLGQPNERWTPGQGEVSRKFGTYAAA
jgi:hypothetical protein